MIKNNCSVLESSDDTHNTRLSMQDKFSKIVAKHGDTELEMDS